eukprot:9426350-Pyramimonas_sp.AAC.1
MASPRSHIQLADLPTSVELLRPAEFRRATTPSQLTPAVAWAPKYDGFHVNSSSQHVRMYESLKQGRQGCRPRG